MRRVFTVIAVCACVLGVGCNRSSSTEGSGNIVTDSRVVSGFDSVEASGSFTLNIQQSNAESLSVTADDNLLQYLSSEVEGTKLVLRPQEHVSLSPTQRITYTVLVKELKSIGIAGDGVLEAKDIDTDSLVVAISGEGDVRIAGQALAQRVAIAGSGSYDASALSSKETSISVTGDGRVVVAVSDRLDVNVVGSADVEYIGDPEVTQHVAGSGTVHQRP